MYKFKLIAIIALSVFMTSCFTLRPVTSVKKEDLKNYQYIYISPTNSLTSSTGSTIEGQYYSTSKTVNPSDVIAGYLSKRGYLKLPKFNPDLLEETVIVNYGESGRRNVGLGYTIEVTIQFISAETNGLICSCTAEGLGSTEADDIRKAINRCLTEIAP